ncbi:MAG: GNAT family N-acetyltransferase [bacterium]|nr:GNAT family N-acetyltransferase [bacterium]
MLKHSDTKFELAKLGVTRTHQGKGIGRLLVEVSIEKAHTLKATTLILATSKLLAPANRLYRRIGFQEVALDELGPLPYHRETFAMALDLTATD